MCSVKWCVEWSDVLSVVMCWVKWCCEWSDILVSFPDILLPIFVKYFLQFLPSFLTLKSLYLLNYTNTVLLLHLITHRYNTVCKIPPYKWSAQRKPVYLTTHKTHDTHTNQPNSQPSTSPHTTHTTPTTHTPTPNPNNQAAPNRHLRPLGHRDRRFHLSCV